MSELFREANGCCPFCGGEINLIEGMVFDYTLDKDGYPNYLNEEHYRISAYCKNCCKQLFVLPNGNAGYYVYPVDINFVIEALEAVTHSNYRLSIISDKILSSSNSDLNPFTNIRQQIEEEKEDSTDLLEEDIPF
jgi:hypothetical protein